MTTQYFATAKRRPYCEELGIQEDELLVGIVGRLTGIKNHELFLQAVARYKAAQPTNAMRVRFVVIGDGNLGAGLKQTAETLGLNDDVIFAGSRKDPENFYPGLDIVALTSKNEGTPLTLIEAMANGIPVISTARRCCRSLGEPEVNVLNSPSAGGESV